MKLPDHLADYVPVKERIAAMRHDHPEWSIMVGVTILEGHYLGSASIFDENGSHIADGSALEKAGKAFDYEKAETSAVGRALVFAGYVDSVALSREEQERSEIIPVRIPPETTPARYQIDGIDEPPYDPINDTGDDGFQQLDEILKRFPVQSAPKRVWSEYVTELVAVCAAEQIVIDWKILAAGKSFNELTIDEFKKLAARAKDILS